MSVINLRESLLKIDKETDCKYDLTSLYESYRLDEKHKKELVKMIANYDSPEALGSYLSKVSGSGPMMENIGDDDISEEELNAIKNSVEDDLEEGLWDDIKKVGKAVGSSIKNDTKIGRAVTNVARGIKNDVKRIAKDSGVGNVVKAAKDAIKDTDVYKNYKGDEGASVAAAAIKKQKDNMKSPENLSKYIVRMKKKYPMFDYSSSNSKITKEIMALCKEKGWDLNKVLKDAGLKIKESMNESLVDRKALEADIRTAVANCIDEVDMPIVEFTDMGDQFKVEVRAELSYDALMDVARTLDPIVAKYDKNAYFEPVTAGILDAYVVKDDDFYKADEETVEYFHKKIDRTKSMEELRAISKELSDTWDDMTSGTIEAIHELIMDRADIFNENFAPALSEMLNTLDEDNERYLKIERVPDNRTYKNFIGDKEVSYKDYDDAKANFKKDFRLEDYLPELNKHLEENDFHYQARADYMDELVIEINWGDWKHEHLRADALVRDFFMNRGILVTPTQEVTEEDGSDVYSAIHYYEPTDIIFTQKVVEESKLTEAEDPTYENDDWEEDNGLAPRFGRTFIEDGYEWKWMKKIGDAINVDGNKWNAWWAFRPEDENNPQGRNVSAFFVVDEEDGFIDWGPCDTPQEALEFLEGKLNEEPEEVNESVNEDAPYTKEQIEKDLKSLTKNFTVEQDMLQCGFEEEANFSKEILGKHYDKIDVNKIGSWYRVGFSGLKK